MSKTKQINFCIRKVQEMLDYIRPDNNWFIEYARPIDITVSDWKRDLLKLVDGEDYIFIYIDGELIYAINVTANSTLYTIKELMSKIAEKF